MPVVSRPQRTEAIQAKYNVTIDFPHLGLHSAAANGNLGLVKYALEHGQPINSVLDGVLPLHVACSGGNDMVVRLLIDRGADVNAPRLPRRYSSEKSRDGSQPIVGTSGSTPLHFACANGHLSILLILLMHGAHPDRADKHGTTPEILARQNGFAACADVLQQWSHNKDRDLRAKDELTLSQNRDSGAGTPGETHPYCGNLDCRICAGRKRLRVKKSIDNALNMLKPSSAHVHSPYHLDEPVHVLETILASPVMPAETLSDTSLHSIVSPTTGADHFARRPSLPDVVGSQQSDPSILQSHSHSSRTRRPRSADTDADTSAHKVKGKISLLNLFKKCASDAATPDTSSSNLSSNKASTLKSSSPSPVPSQLAGLTSPFSTDTSSSAVDLSGDGSPIDVSTSKLIRGRLYSAGDVLTTLQSSPSTALHRAQSDDRLRAHSNPVSFMSLDASGAAATVSIGRQSTRPTILRPHHRSVSSEQTQIGMRRSGSVGPPSARALRFDSTFSAASAISKRHNMHRQASHSPARGLKSVHSIGSICGSITPDSPRSPLGRTPEVDPTGRTAEQAEEPVPARALGADEDEDEQYGIVVVPGSMPSDAHADTSDTLALHTQLSALKLEGRRKSHSVLPTRTPSSPLPSPGAVIPSANFEYPFSITSPPPDDVDSPMVADFASAHGNENRLRGDSMSSMSTTTTSGYLTTPGQTSAQLPTPYSSSNGSTPPEYPALESDGSGRHHVRRTPSSLRDVDRSSKLKAALDIDIRSISTHAQAEALVQRAQRSILDMEGIIETDYNVAGEGNGIGWTPLSAALAAYGETLAIERKFKEEEERQTSTSSARSASRMSHAVPEYPDEDADRSSIMRRLDRKFSLEEKSYSNTVRPARARRPNTSTGSAGSELFQPPRQTDGSLPSTNHPFTSGSQVAATAALSDVRSSSDFVSALTPPKGSHLNVNPETYADSRPRLCRSRTPDPESDIFGPSSLLAGIPLSRVSTAPAQDTFLSPNRSLTIKERQVARATKLAKMGFASPDAWQNTMPGSRSQLGHKQRFAGIKGFVQSLKGK